MHPKAPIILKVDLHPYFIIDKMENELIADPKRLPELKTEYTVDLY